MFQKREIEHSISTRAILKIVIIVLGVVLIYVLRDVLIALFVALVIAAALDPIVDKLQKYKIPRWTSVLVLLVAVFGLIGLIVFLMIPPVKSQIDQLSNNFHSILDQFENIKDFAARYNLIDSSKSFLQSLGDRLGTIAQRAVTSVTGAFNGLVTMITVVVLSAYLVAQERGIKQFVEALTPRKYRPYFMYLVERVQAKMGEWLRGQMILMLFVGVLTYVGLWLMGVDYALILAILAGLLEIIPIIGIPIAIIPALIISFIQSPILALFVLILYIVIQQVENHILVPKVMQKAVGLNPVFVILSLLVGYKLGGILGVILSVPAATALSVFIKDFYDYRVNKEQEAAPQVSSQNQASIPSKK